ncbi:MAG: hypothetical protein AAF597_10470, partial [Bacteroidota bacterium]
GDDQPLSYIEIIRMVNPGLIPESGLFLSRMDGEAQDIVYLTIKHVDLHEQSYPYTVTENASLSWAPFDYGTEGCPHPDLDLAVTQPVSFTIDSWDNRYLKGRFLGVDDTSTAGSFQVVFPRPELVCGILNT